MTTAMDNFGSVSDGLDRAQLDVGPPSHEVHDPRPPPEALQYRKPSIRHAIKDNLLSTIVHPRFGVNKIRAAINEKHDMTKGEPYDHHNSNAPKLAPMPPLGPIEEIRLTDGFEEKPRFPPAKEFVHNPVAAVISTVQDQQGRDAAETFMKLEISHGADVQLLNQHQKVEEATNESEEEAEYKTFVQMKNLRQDVFVRWTVDRHVRIVARKFQGSNTPPKRPKLFGQVPTDEVPGWFGYVSQLLEYELEKYGEYYINPEFDQPMPDRKLLSSVVERLIVASTPLQTLFMKLLSISHWENPTESAGYMALYFFLLFYSYLTRALILFVLLKTLHRGWHPPTLQEMRDSTMHAEDQDVTAHNLGELVTQYGQRAWTEHAIELLGPEFFKWGERISDVMEMTRNFLEWRNPQYTGVTLSILFAGFITITLTPTWLLVQMSFFSLGIVFFVLTPLAIHYPRYRVLLDPMTWLLWRSPTHAEWAISRLQAEAREYLSEDNELKTVDKDTRLIGSFPCKDSNDTNGRVILYTNSISFSPKRSRLRQQLTPGSKKADKDNNKEPGATWSLQFKDIREVHKVTDENKHGGEEAGLEFKSMEGEMRKVKDVARRDEVFSQIIGYSGLLWKRCG